MGNVWCNFSDRTCRIRAAATDSLSGTARLNGIEPYAYMRNVLAHIADHPVNQVDDFLPWNVASQELMPK